MRLTIPDDKQCDETWIECVIEDLWDMVKRVRRKSGKKREQYTLQFGATQVQITMERK